MNCFLMAPQFTWYILNIDLSPLPIKDQKTSLTVNLDQNWTEMKHLWNVVDGVFNQFWKGPDNAWALPVFMIGIMRQANDV